MHVLVAPIYSRSRQLPSEVSVGRAEGLRQESFANLDAMLQVDIASLVSRIGSLSRTKMREVEDAVHFALAVSH